MNAAGEHGGKPGVARPVRCPCLRSLASVLAAVALCCTWASGARAASDAEQLLVTRGELPHTGRIIIRSGFGWLLEDDPAFIPVARVVGEELRRRGLTVVRAAPSEPAEPPKGIEAVRNRPIPEHKGAPRRVMSVAEAVSRMKAMQLAREGRLPQARFMGGSARVPRPTGSGLPSLTPQELIRFALTQEEGLPTLRGQVTIPGRLPEEARASDPAVADYLLTIRFAVLWPASGVPDAPDSANAGTGLAVGWHLVEMACYTLAPAREGKSPERVWTATVQRVAFGTYIRGTAPRMAQDAIEES